MGVDALIVSRSAERIGKFLEDRRDPNRRDGPRSESYVENVQKMMRPALQDAAVVGRQSGYLELVRMLVLADERARDTPIRDGDAGIEIVGGRLRRRRRAGSKAVGAVALSASLPGSTGLKEDGGDLGTPGGSR
jgi:hypothetical protein